MRKLYLKEGLKYIPKIITYCCTNKLNSLYGCMDREFWHYKTIDFPCGMKQEFVLALAIVYRYNLDERFYNKDFIKELIEAAIAFAQRFSHRDGSCDDYYPYERAVGATVFSFYVFTESCLLIEGMYNKFETFLKRRAEWLFNSKESGILSNHHAVMSTALYNMFLLSSDSTYKDMAYKKLNEVLSYQDKEGWFKEYTGPDTGYLTFTVDFLAKFFSKSKDRAILDNLIKAIDFLQYFVHPDGSFGGEYNSRNTYIFLPHGFEIIGKVYPPALRIANSHLKGLSLGKNLFVSDNRIFGHFSYNYLQAYLDFGENRQINTEYKDYARYFPNAGIFAQKTNNKLSIVNFKKGGVVKVFDNKKCLFSNTGFLLKLSNNKNITSALFNKDISIHKKEDTFRVKTYFYYVKDSAPSLIKFIIFRIFLYTLGRFYWMSRLTRKILQKILITHYKKAPFGMAMEIKILDEGLSLKYDIYKHEKVKIRIKEGYITSHFNPLYTAMGDCFQEAVLINWKKIDIDVLNKGKSLTFKFTL